jgi:acyl carrier protein
MEDGTDPLESRIEALFRDHLSIEVPSPDVDLIANGLLDSLAVVELLLKIEQELGVAIPMDDLDVADLRSVRSVAALVARRKGQGTPVGTPTERQTSS